VRLTVAPMLRRYYMGLGSLNQAVSRPFPIAIVLISEGIDSFP
jgi:hypothetical protein